MIKLLNIYLAIGIFLSHVLHALSYWNKGSTELATWFTHISTSYNRSFRSWILLLGILVLFSLMSGFYIRRTFTNRPINDGLRIVILWIISLILASQFITSSVLRILYESGFSFVFVAAIVIEKVFLQPTIESPFDKELYERLWDLLRLSIPIVLGFSALFGGVGAISAFYDSSQTFIHKQIYRHLYLTMYFATGMLAFIMWPIFKQILTMHTNLFITKKEDR